MAASLIGHVLGKGLCTNVVVCGLRQDSALTAKVLSYCQQKRNIRRSCYPPKWFVKRNVEYVNGLLTKENKEFLDDYAVDHYEEQAKIFSPLKDEPWPRGIFDDKTRRVGVLAMKIGYLPQWTTTGQKIYCTILQVLDNHVIRYTPPEEFKTMAGWKPWFGDKYGHCVIGALSCYPWKFTKAYNNMFLEAGVPPKRKLTRFIITDNAKLQPGTPLTAMHFRVGDYVDVSSKTVGHGFQGVVKRWNFSGGNASHGSSKFHRRPGSSGNIGKAGIIKGKKMPGHMGMKWDIKKGVQIVRINTEHNLIYLHGNVSGPNHCYVRIYDTNVWHKKPSEDNPPPMPTFFEEDAEEEGVKAEYFAEDLHQFTSPSITYGKDDS